MLGKGGKKVKTPLHFIESFFRKKREEKKKPQRSYLFPSCSREGRKKKKRLPVYLDFRRTTSHSITHKGEEFAEESFKM